MADYGHRLLMSESDLDAPYPSFVSSKNKHTTEGFNASLPLKW
jgi:hypothetical protein